MEVTLEKRVVDKKYYCLLNQFITFLCVFCFKKQHESWDTPNLFIIK